MPTFAPARLTAARIVRGLTQPELGKRIGKTGNAIFTYETGRATPPPHVVGLLALALGVGAADLFAPDPDDPVLQALADIRPCVCMEAAVEPTAA
ncbi:helix-turn-helix transcriptional regulator [Streptomyces sp. NPDC047974]|uniref:helix-turn-helix domain-containing protein n=1 Tax=Streptomyces sp. NPDC047974 TaxID=3154343 RepID=UPI003407593B